MNVLVTGSNGYLGSHVVRDLMARGHRVTGFDLGPAPDGLAGVAGDLRDQAALHAAAAGMDCIVHIGGMAHINAGAADAIYETNMLAAWNVFRVAESHGIRRVVVCSSDSVIGFTVRQGRMLPPQYLPVTESHPMRATDPYGLSKVLLEQLAHSFHLRNGVKVIILRPVFVLYPEAYEEVQRRRSSPEDYQAPTAHRAPAVGGGHVWHHVDPRDVSRAFCLAVEAGHVDFGTYFVSAPETLHPVPTLALMAPLMAQHDIEMRDEAHFKDRPHAALYSTRAIERDLGFYPEYNLRSQFV